MFLEFISQFKMVGILTLNLKSELQDGGWAPSKTKTYMECVFDEGYFETVLNELYFSKIGPQVAKK